MRAWLFRIAHNRALDLLRSRAIRPAEPIEAAQEVADPDIPDPVDVMMRREAVETAVSRFVELPTMQRSVVILKDVLDQSLEEIAAMLDLTVDAVKAHLARGRARPCRCHSAGHRSKPISIPGASRSAPCRLCWRRARPGSLLRRSAPARAGDQAPGQGERSGLNGRRARLIISACPVVSRSRPTCAAHP